MRMDDEGKYKLWIHWIIHWIWVHPPLHIKIHHRLDKSGEWRVVAFHHFLAKTLILFNFLKIVVFSMYAGGHTKVNWMLTWDQSSIIFPSPAAILQIPQTIWSNRLLIGLHICLPRTANGSHMKSLTLKHTELRQWHLRPQCQCD